MHELLFWCNWVYFIFSLGVSMSSKPCWSVPGKISSSYGNLSTWKTALGPKPPRRFSMLIQAQESKGCWCEFTGGFISERYRSQGSAGDSNWSCMVQYFHHWSGAKWEIIADTVYWCCTTLEVRSLMMKKGRLLWDYLNHFSRHIPRLFFFNIEKI